MPSSTAFATSDASARVGRELVIIESSIWVATMTGFAFTEILSAIYRRHAAGDAGRAQAIFYRYLPLIAYEAQAQVGLALRKELLRRRGAIASAAVRHPAMRADAAALAELSLLREAA